MNKPVIFMYHYLKAKIDAKKSAADHYVGQLLCKGKPVLSADGINEQMCSLIHAGTPFFAGKFGANELSTVRTFDFRMKNYENCMSMLCSGAGFFPDTKEAGQEFCELMIKLIPQADVMGIWKIPFEEYYLNKYGKSDLMTAFLMDIEPWSAPNNPWSAALKGKKVLVIHPFAQTIMKQYERRETLFPGTQILPEFDLTVLKAVQTIAGEQDDRFSTWFDALNWMYEEALKKDFDVAIIGCGAYGFPLAAKLKMAGKQAIHLGGATQIMFGIKGKRWDEVKSYQYIRELYNDNWIYPGEEEKPMRANTVEGGCYW